MVGTIRIRSKITDYSFLSYSFFDFARTDIGFILWPNIPQGFVSEYTQKYLKVPHLDRERGRKLQILRSIAFRGPFLQSRS